MATQPTKNPIPSESPNDLKFNAGKIDEIVNSADEAYSDRFGNARLTWAGIEAISRSTIASLGYSVVRSFEAGATISTPSQALLFESNGDYYRWDGPLPKVVAPGSTPNSAGGEGSGKWVNVSDAILRTDLNNGFENILVEQPESGNFWIDVHPEVRIHRINDRIFIGAASKNDGKITSSINPTNKDWMENIRPATTNNAQFAVLSKIGQGAILGASRSSDFPSAGSLGCIGGSFYGINDNTAYPQTAYGAYLEAQRYVGAGRTHGFELDIVNFGNAVGVQPYDMFQDGLTVGGWIASGAEFSSTKASAALAIINNGASFDKGIVFHSTSISGTDGITGSGVAIEMAKNQAVRWMFGSGDLGSSVSSSVSNIAAQQSLNFSDAGTLFRNRLNNTMFRVDVSDSYVNGIEIIPSNTGSGPAIQATGTDANVDIRLAPKGSGVVDLRNVSSSGTAGSTAMYVPIKINGTLYKLEIKNN